MLAATSHCPDKNWGREGAVNRGKPEDLPFQKTNNIVSFRDQKLEVIYLLFFPWFWYCKMIVSLQKILQ
jgi:hypothetical protein